MALVACAALLTAASGSASGAPANGAGAGTSPPGTPDGVHVQRSAGAATLVDRAGQQMILRGVDDNALVQYPSDYREAPPVSSQDFREMAALGFNFLRLPVSWSAIMPHPGVLDRAYLERITQVVGWARRAGMGVLVDMHQDNFSTVTDPTQESDGAPRWAVLTGGAPCTPDLTTTHCALAAFANFWADASVHGRTLQQWYLEALVAAAKAGGGTRADDNTVGVEIMNEPWPAGPSPFEQRSLYPFYERMITGLRRAGIVVPIWFEPSILRDVTNDALPQAARFSTDQDLVYEVHIYSGVFSPPYGPVASQSSLASSYANAAAEAKVFGTPFDVGEYGSNATPAWNSWLEAQLSLQNQYRVGSGFWLWKQRVGRWYNWSVVQLDGALRSGTLRAQLLSEPHVDAVPGTLIATSSSASRLTATVQGPGGTAVLWGGTVVARGGPGGTPSTLRRVTVDGRAVAARCTTTSFTTTAVSLRGCLVTVHLRAGRHVVAVTP